jgi:hypothetical protein
MRSLPVLLLFLAACDDITAGQTPSDPGPPVLMKLLIQDELPSGGRGVATDLLEKSPMLKCDTQNPCPAGDKFGHPPCNQDLGMCPDPYSADETPAAIGVPGTQGGDQIRLVFQKQLDPNIEVPTIPMTGPMAGMITGYTLKDPTIIGIYDSSGKEMVAQKYWDSTGATVTSDPIVNPFGPALVIKQKTPFLPLTMYSIRIKPDQIKDAKGQALASDVHMQPVKAQYDFTTEGFHGWGGALAIDKFQGQLDSKDVLAIKTTARFDSSTLKATVLKDGQPVETAAAPEFGTDPKGCAAATVSPQQINIFRVKGQDRIDWEPGNYTVSIDVQATDRRELLFSRDNFGKIPFHDVPFRVPPPSDPMQPDKDKNFLAELSLLPWECAASMPADMTGFTFDLARPSVDMSVPDLAMPPDMAVPPMDMGVPLDGTSD